MDPNKIGTPSRIQTCDPLLRKRGMKRRKILQNRVLEQKLRYWFHIVFSSVFECFPICPDKVIAKDKMHFPCFHFWSETNGGKCVVMIKWCCRLFILDVIAFPERTRSHVPAFLGGFMQRSFVALLFSLLLCASAFPQDGGIIQCDPGMDRVPAWTAPGRAYAAEQLNCGQLVSIVSIERGYVKIQIGERFAYVDAKYVRLLQVPVPAPTAERAVVQPIYQQPTLPQTAQQPQSPEPSQPISPAVYTQKPIPSIGSVQEYPRRHEAGLSFEISNIYYDEPGLMRNKGFMYGVSGDYTYRPNNFMLKLDGRFSLGDVDYWSNGTGVDEGLRDYNYETRFSFGYALGSINKASFTPFIGLGYRYLFDGEEGAITTSGAHDYDRKSNYLYSPIGIQTMFRSGSGWSLGLSGEYDLLWHGWQYSEFGNYAVTTYPPIILPNFVAKNDQENGWGARGSLTIIKNFGKIAFDIEPYFRYWDFEDSDLFEIVQYPFTIYDYLSLREPKNTTTEWGAKIGIRF